MIPISVVNLFLRMGVSIPLCPRISFSLERLCVRRNMKAMKGQIPICFASELLKHLNAPKQSESKDKGVPPIKRNCCFKFQNGNQTLKEASLNSLYMYNDEKLKINMIKGNFI